jgi:pimeloyl-ACP methyl ester carboxylesterase
MTSVKTTRLLELYPDLPLTLREAGAGDSTVFVIHGGHGPENTAGIVDHFAVMSQVLQPTHPGWEGTSRPDWFSGMDAIADTYLDLLEDRDLHDVLVVAVSFGGWIASEMVVRDRGHRISRLILIDALGPEVPGHEVQVLRPDDGGVVPDIMQTVYAYGGHSLRNPKLLRRLARTQIPTLVVWGENDTVLTQDFGRAYANAFPNGRFELIPNAGHTPAREAPEATFAAIDNFLASS